LSFHAATPLAGTHTKTDVWITPQWIIDSIGKSDLDPCGWLPVITETAERYLTEKDDGLIQPWHGSIFCNPPYSNLGAWLSRCSEYGNSGGSVIVLCFVRSDTKAWQDNVKTATGVNLIRKRLRFLSNDGIERSNGNAPSALISWGESAYRRIQCVDGIHLRLDK